ncbi:hypothetical protein EGI22_09470 [Lacihabitans sp. LS3-19]|uniref:hypothetical protein n=1 Tax=Lacihabitans sp. LS3-19 TaxID=2487335 RepID=UPI0020CC9B11|nr:hypothetical protein [Lacihabitans sp. LS3-19]MCP9768141.1 hypothetical protein [Lacihabitans sp. LS3-19]
MKYLLRKFLEHREAMALAIFIAGLPFIFFLRDGLRLAPANTYFSIALLFGPLALTLLFKDLKYFESPNKPGMFMIGWFLIITFVYFILRDRFTAVQGLTETFNYILLFTLFVSINFMRQVSLSKFFIHAIIFISLIGAASLLYYTFTNPLYQIGQRASISFEEDGAKGGNPHINARGAFYGLIACVIALKYQKKINLGILYPTVSILLFIVVLFLTQTMLGFMAAFLFISLFTYFNFNFSSVVSTAKFFLFKWYVLLALVLGIGKGIVEIKNNEEFITPITNYLTFRVNNIVKSFTNPDNKKRKPSNSDESANMRIHLLTTVFENAEENFTEGKVRYILFGNGFKHLYVDVPYIEVFDSFGLIVFVFYSIMFFYMAKLCLGEIKNPKSFGTEFLAYFFIYYFIANFTAALVIDYTRLGTYMLIFKFIKK